MRIGFFFFRALGSISFTSADSRFLPVVPIIWLGAASASGARRSRQNRASFSLSIHAEFLIYLFFFVLLLAIRGSLALRLRLCASLRAGIFSWGERQRSCRFAFHFRVLFFVFAGDKSISVSQRATVYLTRARQSPSSLFHLSLDRTNILHKKTQNKPTDIRARDIVHAETRKARVR